MKLRSFCQLANCVWCVIWIVGCGTTYSKAVRLRPERYPTVFQQPASNNLGIGFAVYYPRSSDTSYRIAGEQALRLLAWSENVRVHGERQFEVTAGGTLEFRGENIELLDVTPVDTEVCVFDTLISGRRVWIQVARQSRAQELRELADFTDKTPPWIAHLPPDGTMLYALGTALIARNDEAGSWQVATYNALVEMAFKAWKHARKMEPVDNKTRT
jgi:hypothetical protein